MASLSAAVAVLNRTSSLVARRYTTPFSPAGSRLDLSCVEKKFTASTNSPCQPPNYFAINKKCNFRSLSTLPPTNNDSPLNIPPPASLSAEAGLKAQDAMRLFIEHGVGKRALEEIAEETKQVSLEENQTF